jgi:hypothetical protein
MTAFARSTVILNERRRSLAGRLYPLTYATKLSLAQGECFRWQLTAKELKDSHPHRADGLS